MQFCSFRRVIAVFCSRGSRLVFFQNVPSKSKTQTRKILLWGVLPLQFCSFCSLYLFQVRNLYFSVFDKANSFYRKWSFLSCVFYTVISLPRSCSFAVFAVYVFCRLAVCAFSFLVLAAVSVNNAVFFFVVFGGRLLCRVIAILQFSLSNCRFLFSS